MKGEISYDLVMVDDMSFVEGTFRIGNGEWQVFIFRKDSIEQPELTSGRWGSGVTGVFVRLPLCVRLNKQLVEHTMSEQWKVDEWCEVRGPDSMQLR
jgi:hypothetical protein